MLVVYVQKNSPHSKRIVPRIIQRPVFQDWSIFYETNFENNKIANYLNNEFKRYLPLGEEDVAMLTVA